MNSLRVWLGISECDPSVTLNARESRRSIDLGGWIMVAWVAWWSWAYVQSAVLHRFPQLRIGAAASSSGQYRPSPQVFNQPPQ
jgi:hypothetical protein